MAGTAADHVATQTRIVRRPAGDNIQHVSADICVIGAGAAGASAALEAAKLGRKVVLVDGLPTLGGQMVNSIIGTFCGLFANGTHGHQFTYGMAEDLLRDLEKEPGLIYRRHGPVTTIVYYDEVALGRWTEEAIRKAGITVVLGAVLRSAERDGRRIRSIDLATRYGD
ncbi:MAG TPA: FAD-dependent oxidoreductase, partial [Xanthobacteraceae bacterium]|nr:FAD-dependent oxidoreductase [Xanthobacteraceae bacterium]